MADIAMESSGRRFVSRLQISLKTGVDQVDGRQVLLVAVHQVKLAAAFIGWRSDRVICISTNMTAAI
jgi:hypothetical protein